MRIKSAFSIAEMLVVFVIMSVVAVSVTPFVVKKNKIKTIKPERGRYECFYDNSGSLRERYISNGVVTDDNPVGQCKFNPAYVKNADFIAISAIGGGGGGAYAPKPTTYKDELSDTIEVVNGSGEGSLTFGQDAPDWLLKEAAETGKEVEITVSGNGGNGGSGWGSSVNFVASRSVNIGGVNRQCGASGVCGSTAATYCTPGCPDACFDENKSKGGPGGNGGGTTIKVTLKYGQSTSCKNTGIAYELKIPGETITCTHGGSGTNSTSTVHGATAAGGSTGSCGSKGGSGQGGKGGKGGEGKLWSAQACAQENAGRPGDIGIGGGCGSGGGKGTTLSYSQTLIYKLLTEGIGGAAGETRTSYLIKPFPKECTATIGQGGAAGDVSRPGDFGTSTEVKCDGLTLLGRGGGGGNEYAVIPLLMDGMDDKETTTQGGQGDASNYIANDKVAEKNKNNADFVFDFGYGGKGGGSSIGRKSEEQLRSYDGTPKNIKKDDSKNAGVDDITPPEKGKTGAFVVIW